MSKIQVHGVHHHHLRVEAGAADGLLAAALEQLTVEKRESLSRDQRPTLRAKG